MKGTAIETTCYYKSGRYDSGKRSILSPACKTSLIAVVSQSIQVKIKINVNVKFS